MVKETASQSRSYIIFFLILTLFFLAGGQSFARGVQEDRLAQARQLITEKKYNDAMLLLVQVAREEPDRLDETEQMQAEIRLIRRQLNQETENLTRLLDRGDVDQAKAKISEVEKIDPNPNPYSRNQLKDIKLTVNINFAKKNFQRIMDQGLILLKQKSYAQAAELYLTGYIFMKDEYDESDYGNIIKNQVAGALSDLKASGAEFIRREAEFKALQPSGALLADRPGSSRVLLAPILAQMEALSNLKWRIWASSNLFRSQNDLLRKNSLSGAEDPHLSYNYLVTRGREKVAENEGLAAALDLLYQDNLKSWALVYQKKTEELFIKARASFDAGRWDDSSQEFSGVADLAASGLDLAALWNRQMVVSPLGVSADDLAQVRSALSIYESFHLRSLLSVQAIRVISLRQQSQVLMAKTGQNRDQIENDRRFVAASRQEIQGFFRLLQVRQQFGQSLADQSVALGNETPLLSSYRTAWQQNAAKALADEIALIDRRGQFDYSPLQVRYEELLKASLEIQPLIDGQARVDGGRTIISRYPSQALGRFAVQTPQQADLQSKVQLFIESFTTETPEVAASPAAQNWITEGQRLLSLIQGLREKTSRLIAQAQLDQSQAQQLRLQSLASADQVVASLTAGNFIQAKRSLTDFTDRSNRSLSLQEDLDFRRQRDNSFTDLSNRIVDGENKIVIREVRNYINQGQEAYNIGRFAQAEDTLLRARRRWADTNADANEEVEYWLALAKIALDVSSGREIAPTDPLYNEMQQLLNFARGDYETGRLLVENGNAGSSKPFMNKADSNVKKVLTPFPSNQEARRLQLLIQKINNPTVFPRTFKNLMDQAIAKYTGAPQQGLKELQDLESIDSNFAELQSQIQRFKDKIYAPKVNTVNIDRAKSLISQAQRLAGGPQSGYARAITLLNQALQLEPGNRSATALIDDLQTRAPKPQAAPSLNPAEQELFAQADTLFSTGRFAEAAVIVDNLLKLSKNKNYQPLLKLKQRIDPRL